MILELHRQGVTVSAIARRVGLDRKTVRRYISDGLEPPVYGPRKPRTTQLQRFEHYLRERLAAFPQLTGRRLASGRKAQSCSYLQCAALPLPPSGNTTAMRRSR